MAFGSKEKLVIQSDVNGQERCVSHDFHHPRHADSLSPADIGIFFLNEPSGHNIRSEQHSSQNGSVPYGVNAPMAGWAWGLTDDNDNDISSLPNLL